MHLVLRFVNHETLLPGNLHEPEVQVGKPQTGVEAKHAVHNPATRHGHHHEACKHVTSGLVISSAS